MITLKEVWDTETHPHPRAQQTHHAEGSEWWKYQRDEQYSEGGWTFEMLGEIFQE